MPTLFVRASNILNNALVWSVDPFSYIDTKTLWYPSMEATLNKVANRSGIISKELYKLMAKKYFCCIAASFSFRIEGELSLSSSKARQGLNHDDRARGT
jgi:hypothetical protein